MSERDSACSCVVKWCRRLCSFSERHRFLFLRLLSCKVFNVMCLKGVVLFSVCITILTRFALSFFFLTISDDSGRVFEMSEEHIRRLAENSHGNGKENICKDAFSPICYFASFWKKKLIWLCLFFFMLLSCKSMSLWSDSPLRFFLTVIKEGQQEQNEKYQNRNHDNFIKYVM